MLPYFLVKYNLNNETAVTVAAGFNEKDVRLEFKQSDPDAVILEITEYPNIQFFVVEPLKVEKGLLGYNSRQQFFNGGLLGVDVFDMMYLVKYEAYPEPVTRIEDDYEVFEIGKAIFMDVNQTEIASIVLEGLDESHLIDRLSAEVIKLHASRVPA